MPQFDDIVHIRTLDPELVPSGSAEVEADSSSRKRLIFVGDVHGCKAECRSYISLGVFPPILTSLIVEELLEKVSFKPNSGDHLILTGDLINKGPDTTGVVDLVRRYSASCVRGNHEDRILLVRRELVKTNTLATPEDDEESYLSSREVRERALARSLSDEQAKWLSSCPVILDVGPVPGIGQVVVVHAGLVPGVELEKQDPSSVMTMRTIDLDTHVPSPKKKGMNWAKVCFSSTLFLRGSV
jgi:3',5'-cyclic AMP phosphodiesterase CpdA